MCIIANFLVFLFLVQKKELVEMQQRMANLLEERDRKSQEEKIGCASAASPSSSCSSVDDQDYFNNVIMDLHCVALANEREDAIETVVRQQQQHRAVLLLPEQHREAVVRLLLFSPFFWR